MTGYESKRDAAQDKLAQPAQEPVAWMYQHPNNHRKTCYQTYKPSGECTPLYTTPPQRPWLEPTGNEWFEWWRVSNVAHETEVEIDFADFLIIAQAVVAKLKEKNNGT